MVNQFNNPWTADHTTTLRALYPSAPWAEVVDKVGHTKRSCHKRASELGIKRLSILDSAREARRSGEVKFLCNTPCQNGHNGQRYSFNGSCVACEVTRCATYARKGAHKIRERERKARKAKPQEYRTRDLRRYHKNRDSINARAKRRRDEATEDQKLKDAQRSRTYYGKNKERIIGKNAAYRKANPGYCLAASAKRRALKRGAPGSHTKRDLDEIYALQKGKCAYCKISLKLARHVDHIIALSAGGTNLRSNLQFLCPPCNLSKNKKDPVKFARMRGLLI